MKTPWQLTEHAKPWHVWVFFLGAAFTISQAVLSNSFLPFLLTNFAKVPFEEQGQVTAAISTVTNLVQIPLFFVYGALSDRIGRKSVFVFGMLCLGATNILFPLSESLSAVFVISSAFAVGLGAAGSMISTVLGDLVVNSSRGKAIAVQGMCTGVGAGVSAALLSHLPSLFFSSSSSSTSSCTQTGHDSYEAARIAGWKTYAILATACVVVALVLFFGLGGKETMAAKREDEDDSFQAIARDGFGIARRSWRIQLACAMAFVSRADLALATTFLPQLCTQYLLSNPPSLCCDAAHVCCPCFVNGTAQLTVRSETVLTNLAVSKSGILIAITGSAGLLVAPFVGVAADRCNRLLIVAISLFGNTLAYGLLGTISNDDDPTGLTSKTIFAYVFLLGLSEVAGVISTQLYVQQEAPPTRLGAVCGLFSLCGCIGVVINIAIGGALFSGRRSAVFLWMCALNFTIAVLCCVGVLIDRKAPKLEIVAADGDSVRLNAADSVSLTESPTVSLTADQ